MGCRDTGPLLIIVCGCYSLSETSRHTKNDSFEASEITKVTRGLERSLRKYSFPVQLHKMAAKDDANYTNSSVEEIRDEVNRVISIELIPVMVYLGLLSLFGGIGNLLVCFVYYSRLRMSTQHFLIICLALFDLLTCFLVIPFEINDLSHYFNFTQEAVCKTLRYRQESAQNMFTTFSCFNKVTDRFRYRKVCRPFKPQMTMRNVKIALAINLLLTIVLAIPAGVIYGIRTTVTFVTVACRVQTAPPTTACGPPRSRYCTTPFSSSLSSA
ncbi:hypothetical protein C0Q70_08051 [Pomacea canaliculata]|uniref:G-protein coupled receptors family 1 profile domain-containing protein n=1 Tax=Pomacea canaliculata TaxID=400727 RepID=A0A2T7PGP8_POMCA|nr:hypothetical protein C0Q70_08051 [Pomacea canaliculata]